MEAPSLPGFQLEQTFFGFKPDDRVTFHKNIFNLIWYGDGRWDWDTIYNMPIFLRKFYVTQVNKIFAEQAEAAEEAAEKRKNAVKSKTKQPDAPPFFSTATKSSK
jgi:hypothetical protein